MKNALIIVGKNLKYNQNFISYLKAHVQESIDLLDMVCFVDKRDSNISLLIKESISQYENIIIATEKEINLVGKILSSLTNDSLVVHQDMLLPAKFKKCVQNSYSLICKKSQINVLKVYEQEKLPQVLLSQKVHSFAFFFFNSQKENIQNLIEAFELEVSCAYLIEGLYHFVVNSSKQKNINQFLKSALKQYEENILVGDDLSFIVVKKLLQEHKTITTAESCTGGLIASALVKHSGVSAIFKGGIVSYADEIKHKSLGVKQSTLQRYGAVSKNCVDEMLQGALEKFDTEYAVAVSGVAGPDGGSINKPVGTIFVGVKRRAHEPFIKKIDLNGDRRYIQQSTVLWAFKLLVLSDKKLFFKFMPNSLDK